MVKCFIQKFLLVTTLSCVKFNTANTLKQHINMTNIMLVTILDFVIVSNLAFNAPANNMMKMTMTDNG